jgi:S-adenosylmethionine hydrolase
VITLLTDFGLVDPYVGEMKAVLLDGAPGTAVVDLTHGVQPGNVREGAWLLFRSWDRFPPGSCHLAVVDPGVGGARRPIAALAGGHAFVGPDNGLLMAAIDAAHAGASDPLSGGPEIREITVREIDRPRRGTTFDGRDLFAPTAARLAAGRPLTEVGPEVHDPVRIEPFAPRSCPGGWEVEIVRIDRFGNLITTVTEEFLRETFGEDWRLIGARIGDRVVRGVRIAYEDVEPGELLLSIGGGGTLEISASRASACRRLGVSPGEAAVVTGPRNDSREGDREPTSPGGSVFRDRREEDS